MSTLVLPLEELIEHLLWLTQVSDECSDAVVLGPAELFVSTLDLLNCLLVILVLEIHLALQHLNRLLVITDCLLHLLVDLLLHFLVLEEKLVFVDCELILERVHLLLVKVGQHRDFHLMLVIRCLKPAFPLLVAIKHIILNSDHHVS